MSLISFNKDQDSNQDEDWYNPGESRHLTTAEVQALAGSGQVSPLAYEHYNSCYECQRDVSRTEKWFMGGSVGADMPSFAGSREEASYQTPVRYEHLSLAEIKAIASGDANTVSPAAYNHYASCSECSRAVNRY